MLDPIQSKQPPDLLEIWCYIFVQVKGTCIVGIYYTFIRLNFKHLPTALVKTQHWTSLNIRVYQACPIFGMIKYQQHVLYKQKHMLHALQLISLFENESLIYIAIFTFNSLSFLWGKSHFPVGGNSNRSPAYSVICCFKPKCGVSGFLHSFAWPCESVQVFFILFV